MCYTSTYSSSYVEEPRQPLEKKKFDILVNTTSPSNSGNNLGSWLSTAQAEQKKTSRLTREAKLACPPLT